ncbi:MAG: class I SAM-dependent rRNA methyltransferase [Deltaproteobacteria bacterium]|nr:class I SAM-dependent rRNA methyltransferase [Deltaproteobacteria bacterium]
MSQGIGVTANGGVAAIAPEGDADVGLTSIRSREPIVLHLRPKAGRRVLSGHPWVFSNELADLPKKDAMPPGSPIVLEDSRGKFVGRGYAHPGTLITARILTRDRAERIDSDFFITRLQRALDRRAVSCAGRAGFRWVHAEGDGLPGLILDRYDSADRKRASLQVNTAGMDALLPTLVPVLRDHFGIDACVMRCTGRGRSLEGLPNDLRVAWGEPAPVGLRWTIDDDGAAVTFDPLQGQKTGLFLDMWMNRRRFAPFLQGKVADLYSYVGQWGLAAAKAGATEVVCVDRSRGALDEVRGNFEANGVGHTLATVQGDVDRWLDGQPARSLDGIVCDPPAFIQRRKDGGQGRRAYRKVFSQSLSLVRPGGFAVLGSCSYHLSEEQFADAVQEASRVSRREVTVLMRGGQAPCHPVPAHVPETRYLKCWLVQVGGTR